MFLKVSCQNSYNSLTLMMHEVSGLSYGMDLSCDHQMTMWCLQLHIKVFTTRTFYSRFFCFHRNWFIYWEEKMNCRCICLQIVIRKPVNTFLFYSHVCWLTHHNFSWNKVRGVLRVLSSTVSECLSTQVPKCLID